MNYSSVPRKMIIATVKIDHQPGDDERGDEGVGGSGGVQAKAAQENGGGEGRIGSEVHLHVPRRFPDESRGH